MINISNTKLYKKATNYENLFENTLERRNPRGFYLFAVVATTLRKFTHFVMLKRVKCYCGGQATCVL